MIAEGVSAPLERSSDRVFAFERITRKLGNGAAFHAKKAATMQRMISRRHNPLTNHPGIPANPQNASNAATTASISIVTAHDNIFCRSYGLKRARGARMT